MAKRVLLCISCSSQLVPWGKTKSGKRRWFCKSCKTTRVYHKRKTRDIFPLFRQYVLWGHTYEQIAPMSGYSKRFLIGEFHKLLEISPPYLHKLDQSTFDETYLLID